MKKDTRLMIQLTYDNGDEQGFGYDSWYNRHKKMDGLLESVRDDFNIIPEHVSMHLFYDNADIELGHVENWDELSAAIREIVGTL